MDSARENAGLAGLPAALAARVQLAAATVSAELLRSRQPQGYWTGELSSSALSTATAVMALSTVQRASSAIQPPLDSATRAGRRWLIDHVNPDGGWGDTVQSVSNLSTTTLCWAASGASQAAANSADAAVLAGAERWLSRQTGGLEPDRLAAAVIGRYGKDRTFSVPILTMCALAGKLGAGAEAWRHVIPLPFELAAFPHRWFASLRLPVVSYALPALIAIGQARHYHRPSRNPIVRAIRSCTRRHTLEVLTRIQPVNGGFLEATPLTSFVTMSLAGSEEHRHPVVQKGVQFLLAAQRADGSWPIDTNLATWVTTLAVNALSDHWRQEPAAIPALRQWLLQQQHRVEHPYTHAAPGGWAWTHLPGGVPDADDTAGVLLALRQLGPPDLATREAAAWGLRWLLDLQNRDGGIPTFCRGWGHLPFDRSSPDISAHALRAWLAWSEDLPADLGRRVNHALPRLLNFLASNQHPDGSWAPLWFGNQHAGDETNRTYGTSRVLCALVEVLQRRGLPSLQSRARSTAEGAIRWLTAAQNGDGGWGGAANVPSTVEETALAVEALAGAARSGFNATPEFLSRGVNWLIDCVESEPWREPSPIGFYFARLWYSERLYPIIFTAGALRQLTSNRAAET